MKKAGRIAYGVTVAGLLGLLFLFPFPTLGAEPVPIALEEAKAAIDRARMTGAEKSAPDDLAQARSWLVQAEKQQAESQSILSRTMKLVKSNEASVREITYLASMAKVKAQIAEAKARKVIAAAELQDARKDLADFQSSLEILKKKQAEAEAAKTVQAKAEAERKALEKSKQNVTVLEAQKKKELEEAQKKKAELDTLQQKELARVKLDAERQELQKQKESLKANAREEQMVADRKKMEGLQQKMAAIEKEKAMQADAVKIPQATVKSTDKEIVITLLEINVLTPKNEVSSGGKAILDQVGAFLKKHAAGAQIAIRGYTDSVGKAEANRTLSEKRAKEVKKYLVLNQNIPAANVTEQGLGSADPVASNASVAGRALNRRMEIVVPLVR
jgi:outer membrane protein OmpA-like peptidoglycan-associated protein